METGVTLFLEEKFQRGAFFSQKLFPSPKLGSCFQDPLEFVFQEQSYSSLHLGWSLVWDHVRGDIEDPCCAIADFCGVIDDLCCVVAIPEAIGGRAFFPNLLNIIKHC